ncbi:sodium:proton antiporter NhaD [Halioxenophilus sp. WMMB6]|uniref:sodium:proton antiporter NhaD n=1 Tax=Halioxenophilus sp. WMMB6 TaxID=3073815 RepID=UPI00295F206A|nr:sodium:proton antiporter NhaD [Halioxenophilus sp. WMMB6]
MNLLSVALILLALLALLSIIFEEVIHVNKAKTTLFIGCLAWIILFIAAPGAEQQQEVLHALNENLLEIASLWLFLMSTMTFVAYLNAKGMIQSVVQKIFPSELPVKALLLMVAIFSLVLSAICDNVTATLVSLGLVQAFSVEREVKFKMAALVVFSVNSGGVALITGDVTTLMIFLAGHVTMVELVTLLVPSLVSVVLLAIIFTWGSKGRVSTTPVELTFTRVDVAITAIFFATIVCTMIFNVLFGIPPVLTFLTGLSLMFLVGRMSVTDSEQTQVLEYIRQIEYDTLLFFLGILLIVGMLQQIDVLTQLAHWYMLLAPEYANFVAGVVSSILDNVPLTAALLKANPALDERNWLGLTYAVGVGGSLLIIGSAAGIIVMSKLEGMTFGRYIRFLPALALSYSVGYALTLLLAGIVTGT